MEERKREVLAQAVRIAKQEDRRDLENIIEEVMLNRLSMYNGENLEINNKRLFDAIMFEDARAR